jgi:hypothetical protein
MDTQEPPEPEVKRLYAALARFIASRSPTLFSRGRSPIYVGPHLATQIEEGALTPIWSNGAPAHMLPKPRFKQAGLR